ncbi:hypothetical protein a10_07916 [Streptomyces acidiscabies]|nr:hypothetical protein a10_07916 [Streptomyces acidiscabies]
MSGQGVSAGAEGGARSVVPPSGAPAVTPPQPHTPHPHNHHPPLAATIAGSAVPASRVDAVLDSVPARDRATRPEGLARDERQRRRWATQVVVVDELARRACVARGLAPPPELVPGRVLGVSGTDVADLGSIVAVALAHSAAARALLAALEGEQRVGEADVREYYERNPDRFLTPEALRRGVDPFRGAKARDLVPYARVRDGVEGELRRARGRQAFFDWLDRERAGVRYTHGHEHPGDPGHPDHEHRH